MSSWSRYLARVAESQATKPGNFLGGEWNVEKLKRWEGYGRRCELPWNFVHGTIREAEITLTIMSQGEGMLLAVSGCDGGNPG